MYLIYYRALLTGCIAFREVGISFNSFLIIVPSRQTNRYEIQNYSLPLDCSISIVRPAFGPTSLTFPVVYPADPSTMFQDTRIYENTYEEVI